MYCTDYSIHLQCKLGEKPVQPSNLVFTFLAIVTPRRSRKFRKRSPDFLPGSMEEVTSHPRDKFHVLAKQLSFYSR